MHPSAHGAIVVCQDRAAILMQIAQFYTEELDMNITTATGQAIATWKQDHSELHNMVLAALLCLDACLIRVVIFLGGCM